MEAAEALCGAVHVQQMSLQQVQSRVRKLRSFQLLSALRVRCPNDLQSVYGLRDHTPMNPAEKTTPFRATTSSRMRCARVEISTSAALAIFSFSIAGSRLCTSSATISHTGHCGPPPINASIRIDGPGRPAARNTAYNSDPKYIRAPLALSACFIQVREHS